MLNLMRAVSFGLVVAVFGCERPTLCTLNFVYGLNVYVSDRVTQFSLVDPGTLVVATDGAFADTATAFAGTFQAAGERPGRYAVSVERSGYQKWSQSNVQIESDGCHVEPVSLHARLDAATP